METQTFTPDVVAVLVDNHRRFLRFLEKRIPSPEVAQDILQDAIVRGMTKAPSLEDDESVVAWFYRVLRNALVDHYRHQDVEQRALARFGAELDDRVEPVDE